MPLNHFMVTHNEPIYAVGVDVLDDPFVDVLDDPFVDVLDDPKFL